MPIYEYRCDNCGHELETIQKISEPPLVQCPECDTDSLRKKVSAAAFRLKGSGWYETDFKSGKKKNVGGDDAPPSTGSDSKDDGGKGDGESSGTDAGKAAKSSDTSAAAG